MKAPNAGVGVCVLPNLLVPATSILLYPFVLPSLPLGFKLLPCPYETAANSGSGNIANHKSLYFPSSPATVDQRCKLDSQLRGSSNQKNEFFLNVLLE